MMDLAAELLFYGITGIIIYVYAGYPLMLAIFGIFKRRALPRGETRLPSVALIISAHNEDRIIREKIENSLKLDYPRNLLRIIVASDGSVDRTNNIVRDYEGYNISLKTFEKREGKSATLNKAILGVEEEIVVFSDANAFYREDALLKLVRHFADEEVGCAVGRLIYLDSESYVGRGESLYWRYEGLLNRLESRMKSVLVATGTIFAIRRSLFRPVIRDVANDFQTPAEIASQGYGVVYDGEAVAYERSSYFFTEEFNRKRRIIVRGLTGFNHLKGDFGGSFRIYQFVSRKLLRWWIGALLPVLYVANVFLLGDPVFYAFFLMQNAFYIFAMVGAVLRRGRVRSRIFFIPFYFVMVNTAALAAILTYMTGGRLSSWEKAETTRDMDENYLETPVLRVIEGNKKAPESLENLNKIT
ncbi:MAG: glycosyltransferase family 2 protein [Candidatus Krumholzibacteria bacterium]|jgi:cellulose synthase/poly-beta-1,6-N-acetylglucosamine synthase-like glycosyltransferase|nr:glycosyltransferase family 2 protein [Candidatus Krumholzibacteria bacterium]